MNPPNRILVLCSLIIVLPIFSYGADPFAAATPSGPRWWPSEWGADDQRGAINRLGPKDVLRATAAIKEGTVYQLGHVYEPGMPGGGGRKYELSIPGLPVAGPFGKNRVVYNDELVTASIGQIGTQLDGLGHIGARIGQDDVFYNGFKLAEFGAADGLKKLGVENVGVFFTRGVFLDIAALKGVSRLERGYVITPSDLEAAAAKIGVTIEEGDAVLIRTGHGQLWMKDNATFGKGWAGIGLDAAKWLTQRKIVLVGSDTPSTEVYPHVDPDRPWEVHQWLIARNGVYNLENLDLEEVSKDGVSSFAFVFAPLKFKGATGSPGNPIAVR